MAHQPASRFDPLRVLATTFHQFQGREYFEKQLARRGVIRVLRYQSVELGMRSRQDIGHATNPARRADHQTFERNRVAAAEHTQPIAAAPQCLS